MITLIALYLCRSGYILDFQSTALHSGSLVTPWLTHIHWWLLCICSTNENYYICFAFFLPIKSPLRLWIRYARILRILFVPITSFIRKFSFFRWLLNQNFPTLTKEDVKIYQIQGKMYIKLHSHKIDMRNGIKKQIFEMEEWGIAWY